MASRRVLHFIESEGVYGAERVILTLSSEMRRGGQFTPVVGCIVPDADSPSALYDAALDMGLEATKVILANSRLPWQLPRAARQLKALGIDVVHSHGYKPAVFGALIYPLTKIPNISTCHLWFEPARAPLKTRVMIRLEKFFYRWYPRVVGVSRPILESLRKSGVPPAKLTLLHNGIELQPPPSEDTLRALKDSLHIEPDEFCILNTARLTRQKGQHTLIEAASILRTRQIPFRILIVGQGPLESDLAALINRFDLERHVQLLGFRNDIRHLLELADAFVLPSLDEGMPMSLLEAAGARAPIITTNVGDISAIVRHRSTGLVVPVDDATSLADAIQVLQNDRALARTLAANAYDTVKQNYTSRAMYEQYATLYRAVV